MSRKKHKVKEIEAALKHAEKNGWTVVVSGGGSAHAWGRLRCPANKKCRTGQYCEVTILSTPKNEAKHVRTLRKVVDGCSATDDDDEESDHEKS